MGFSPRLDRIGTGVVVVLGRRGRDQRSKIRSGSPIRRGSILFDLPLDVFRTPRPKQRTTAAKFPGRLER